jgi:hypothetical protein
MTENNLPPMKVAFVVNNKVADVLHTDAKLAAILLSNPVIVDVTGANNTQNAFVDDDYNPETGEFITARVVDIPEDTE